MVTPVINNNPSARKYICQFSELLNIKQKTSVLVLGAVKTKHTVTSKGNSLWLAIQKRRGHTKINERVKQFLGKLILFS